MDDEVRYLFRTAHSLALPVPVEPICTVCGAAVPTDNQMVHTSWHAQLNMKLERLEMEVFRKSLRRIEQDLA